MNNIVSKGRVVDFESAKKTYMSLNEFTSQKDSSIKLVDDYLNLLDWKVNENSNMSYSIQGLNNYLASEISKITG